MFQFLIGRLKTQDRFIKALLYLVFQFLIGRLKTHWIAGLVDGLTCVSIPYRQAQNLTSLLYCIMLGSCFNSLQVGSKRKVFGKKFIKEMGFNSLQVGSKHHRLSQITNNLIRFNSSQVGSKREKMIREKIDISEFQFLIGRLKTRHHYPTVVLYLCVSIPHRQAQN